MTTRNLPEQPSQHSMQAAGQACQKRSAAGSKDDVAIMVDGGSTTPAAATAASPAAAAAVRSKPRVYYVDWLRVLLTVLVLLHHCLTEYLSTWKPWKARKGDTAHWLLVQAFVNGNQAYFMTLFFFLSGLYVPPSYKRKGPGAFLWDRTLRLVTPVLFYSMVIAPFNIWWVKHTTDPSATIGQAYREWFAPGWPSKYVLPTGPPWFIWMLWCFNVAYVIIKVAADSPAGKQVVGRLVQVCCRKGVVAPGDDDALAQQAEGKKDAASAGPGLGAAEYTTKQWFAGVAVLTGVLFTLMYATRVLDMLAFNVQPAVFISRGPFVAFMPDYFVVYVVAFALGIHSGPASWNVLARLPSGYASWWLSIAGIWWVLAGWVPNVLLLNRMSMQFGMGPFLGSWLLRTFVEQSFCVVWSAGLLVLFRDAFNVQPRWLGRHIINAAYGAYIIHPPVIILFARAVMGLDAVAPSAVINAAVISLPVVVCSWAVAAAVRAIPGFDRVL